MRPKSHDVTIRDDHGRVETLVTITPLDGDAEQAKAIAELVRAQYQRAPDAMEVADE